MNKLKWLSLCMLWPIVSWAQVTEPTPSAFRLASASAILPILNDPRPWVGTVPHVRYSNILGKMAWSVMADSVEMDSISHGRTQLWKIEMTQLVSNKWDNRVDSVAVKRSQELPGATQTYADTAFRIQSKTVITDLVPGIDVMFFDADSFKTGGVLFVWVTNRELAAYDQSGYQFTLPVYVYDTLTISDDDTLRGKKDTLYSRPFPIRGNPADVGMLLDMRPITGTGDTLCLGLQYKINGGSTRWYAFPGGNSLRILQNPVAFIDTSLIMRIPADSLIVADSVRVAEVGAVTKGRNIIKRLFVRFRR